MFGVESAVLAVLFTLLAWCIGMDREVLCEKAAIGSRCCVGQGEVVVARFGYRMGASVDGGKLRQSGVQTRRSMCI